MTALKYDTDKPDWTLLEDIHPEVLEDVVRILMFGEEKYSRSNWTEGADDPDYWQRIHAAILRHVMASLYEVDDPEHGLPHLCAAIVNILFLESFRRWAEDAEDIAAVEARRNEPGYTEREVDVFFEGYECRRQEEAEREAAEAATYIISGWNNRIAGSTPLADDIKNTYYEHDPHLIVGHCANCDVELKAGASYVSEVPDFDAVVKFCSDRCVKNLREWQGR